LNIIQWLESKHPHLAEELKLLDRATDGALFGEPNHTLSYNIAKAAQGSNLAARRLCHLLTVLSPNHCANALAAESTTNWKEATEEVG